MSDVVTRRRRRGKPGQQLAPLKEKTMHAVATKQRIRAIVAQVVDELQERRVAGKSDFVAMLADEIEEGGIAAWKSLMELLPRDDVDQPSGASFSFGPVFVAAAIEASKRATDMALPVVDVTADPVQSQTSIEESEEW